jgi:hypothetical protein
VPTRAIVAGVTERVGLVCPSVWRTSHDVHLHPASRRPDQPLDDHHVLEALVLDEQPVPRLVDEPADPIPPGTRAPDDMTLVARLEGLPVPVGLEALDDLGDVMAAGGDHRVVTRLRQVGCGPVERLDKGRLIVDDHRFLVREGEGRIGVFHVDIRPVERLAGGLVVVLAAAPGRVEHHSDLDAAPPRRDDRHQQRRIREDKHLDAKRSRGAFDGGEDRLCGVVRQHYQRARHASSFSVS